MSKTQDNLQSAFSGESKANRRYLVFAKAAESEGRPGIAKIFKAAAEGETIHALNHLKNLGEVKNTIENLKTAIDGESYEIETMYPGFLSDAQDENEGSARISFNGALEVEKIHKRLFEHALANLESGEDMEIADYYICPVCGFPASPEAPERCPICGTPKEKFYKV